MTKSEHRKIHNNDPIWIKKHSKSLKGKTFSDEHRKHLSEARKGRHFWNNGIICKYCKEQPGSDFVRGRL